MRLSKLIFIFLTTLVFACPIYSQVDSIKNEFLDTAAFVMKKSPTSALLYSIIPGGGQLYVGSYVKAPIFFGATTAMAGFILWNNSLFIENKNIATNLLDPNNKQEESSGEGDYNKLPHYTGNSYQISLAKQRKEFYRDNRDRLILYFIVVYALNFVDAYVGAHLYDFDIKDNIGFNYDKSINRYSLTLNIPIK